MKPSACLEQKRCRAQWGHGQFAKKRLIVWVPPNQLPLPDCFPPRKNRFPHETPKWQGNGRDAEEARYVDRLWRKHPWLLTQP